jgi:hypothetical protein
MKKHCILNQHMWCLVLMGLYQCHEDLIRRSQGANPVIMLGFVVLMNIINL